MKKAKEKKVLPTYVLLSPYACQNNKTVEFIAKHGSLIFATIFLIGMIALRLSNLENSWILFLPQFVFFSLAYIFGCITNNKWYQLIQILAKFVLILPYTFFVCGFIKKNFNDELHDATKSFRVFVIFLMQFYPTFLHLVYRKHFVKDLSTPRSVSILNFVDFFYGLLFIICYFGSVPLVEWLWTLFPAYSPYSLQENSESYMFWLAWAFFSLYEIGYLVGWYVFILYWNRSKSMASLSEVKFDNDGRAWFSVCGNIVLFWKTLAKSCMWHVCGLGRHCSLDKLAGRNRSSVKPEESQKVLLKPTPELIV